MARTVGFLCPLKPEWLNKTVNCVIEEMDPGSIKEILDNYISFDLKSPDNIRKTREMLMNIWVYPFDDEKANQIRQRSIEIIKEDEIDNMVLHWCMLLIYYPVFSDVAGMIGKILNMQDSFSLIWLKSKMAEQWGERTTLLRSVEKIMQTIRQLQFVRSEKGIYTVNRVEISNFEVKK